MILFLEYPKCSTCKKAKKWLEDKGVEFNDRDIVINNPTSEEIEKWQQMSGLDIKRFFNTSGMKYRELGLKEKLEDMDFAEKTKLLGSDGMLVKRPLVIGDGFVLAGFREKEWTEKLV